MTREEAYTALILEMDPSGSAECHALQDFIEGMMDEGESPALIDASMDEFIEWAKWVKVKLKEIP